jgi:hypothetical protein
MTATNTTAAVALDSSSRVGTRKVTGHLIVVADRFNGFVNDERVQTVSGLITMIASGCLDDLDDELRLHRGQGVGQFECAHIVAALNRRRLSPRVTFVDEEIAVAGRDVVHKNRLENVLLADLQKTGEHSFKASLRIHGENELLLDHQTGEHVQGMVAVEAFRQMFLAIFEVGYRHHWPLRNYYVVWNSVQLTFENFLFPLPAEVSCTVREFDVSDVGKLEFQITVELHQFGRRITCGEIGFTSFEIGRIAPFERRRAAKTLESCLKFVDSTNSDDQTPPLAS